MKLYENPAFSHLEPKFVQNLQHLIDISAHKNNPYEILQLLIKVNNELEKAHISCTPEMQSGLLLSFKDTLPKSKRRQFETFFNSLPIKNKF